MKPYHVGVVKEVHDAKMESLRKDFEELRKTAWRTGLFKTNPWFYIAHAGKPIPQSYRHRNILHKASNPRKKLAKILNLN